MLLLDKSTATLDKKAYPLMMHLSILPKYDINPEKPSYDPIAQASIRPNYSMSNSWCSDSSSTGKGLLNTESDEDTREDD